MPSQPIVNAGTEKFGRNVHITQFRLSFALNENCSRTILRITYTLLCWQILCIVCIFSRSGLQLSNGCVDYVSLLMEMNNAVGRPTCCTHTVSACHLLSPATGSGRNGIDLEQFTSSIYRKRRERERERQREESHRGHTSR